MIITRSIIFLIIFITTLYLPWWVPFILLCVLSLVIPYFAESVFFGVFYDLIYAGGMSKEGLIFGFVLFAVSIFAPRSIMIETPWASFRT
jgi:hypothetical protein